MSKNKRNNTTLYSHRTKKQINEFFIDACVDGDLEKAKFLLTSPELPHRANIRYLENTAIHQSCEHNHLHIMQYLLTSPELKVHADIHAKDDWALTIACNEGHFEIVKYLLTSQDLKEHSNFHVDQLSSAIRLGEFEIADYLLNSPDLKENFDIHMEKDSIFKQACEFGDMETIQYLIHELNIDITEAISDYLAEPTGRKERLVNEAKNMFELRELNKELNQNLNENSEAKKKPKL